MRLVRLLVVLPALALLLSAGVAYGLSPPTGTHAYLGAVGEGILQGHVYNYDGSPAAFRELLAFTTDAKGEPVFDWIASGVTDADGFYRLSGAPATTHGAIWVDGFLETGLVLVSPGTSTCDLRPGAIKWSVSRGGPWASDWKAGSIEVAGLSETGSPVLSGASAGDVGTGATVTGSALALPADVRVVLFRFRQDEIAVWDAADPGNAPVPVTAGATAPVPFTFDQASAYRALFTNSFWRSGRPGTVLRLALENIPAGTTLKFLGNDTTWGHKRYTSTGPQRQIVSLKVPADAPPGPFDVIARESIQRSPMITVQLEFRFQVCTLNATETAIRRGTPVQLKGTVPVLWNEDPPRGTPKYVWIYKRTRWASQPPTVWDAAQQGWKLVARVRTDSSGHYRSAWLSPARTTWFVARYAGDAENWRAYSSVRRVRVD
jgi:hypothetical protein